MAASVIAPSRRRIQEIAVDDPVRAIAVAQCGQAQQTVSGRITLTSADLGNPRSLQLDQIPAYSWLDDLSYDIDAPNFAPGNLGRWDALDKMARRPGIDARIAISQGFGPRNHLVGLDFQPIQQLLRGPQASESVGCCDWLKGIFIHAYQALQMQVQLTRPLAGQDEPLVLSVTMKIATVGINPYVAGPQWGITSEADAISGLGKLGFIDDVGAFLEQRAAVRETGHRVAALDVGR